MRSCSFESGTSNVSSLADEFLARASEALAQACHAKLGAEASFADLEAELYASANEAVRRQLEVCLRRIAEGHGEQVLVDGKRYRRHEPGEVDYHSLAGDIRVQRWSYREVGVRNGPTVVPLELAAGLFHRATPALAHSVAHGYGAGPTRHYEAHMKAAHRVLPPHATVERLAQRIGGRAAREVVQIEAQVRACETLPDGAHALTVSLDRTSVAMAEERPPTALPNSHRRQRKKPYQRRLPDPFDVNWRMLYVGTVSIVDDHGEVITTRKYHATPEEETAEIMARMMADVAHYRAKKALPVVVVQDGAPEMWNVVRPALRNAGVKKWTEVIDRFHTNEHLAAALEIIEPDEATRRRQFEAWQHQIERNDRAIPRIAKWLSSKLYRMQRSNHKAVILAGHVHYISTYASQMKYAAYRRAGLPIASGPVEGACKSLVAARAKRSGQRWKQDGLTAALTLRALQQSDRFTAFWRLLSNQFSANICAA